MAIKNKQSGFEKNAKHLLDDSVASMSEASLSQLKHVRQVALSHTHKRGGSYWLAWSVSATAFAVALLVFVVMPVAPLLSPAPLSVSELGQLVMVEDLDLYDDLDFYQWLGDGNG